MSDACTCAELHANHVHDDIPCTVRCPACCAASWERPLDAPKAPLSRGDG